VHLVVSFSRSKFCLCFFHFSLYIFFAFVKIQDTRAVPPKQAGGWMTSPTSKQDMNNISKKKSSNNKDDEEEEEDDMGWNDVDFSPMNSPAANWVRPENIATTNGNNNKFGVRTESRNSARSQTSNNNFEVLGKTIPSKSPVVHSAGERPHTYYGHPSSMSNEPDFSVCQHDSLR
jgi:hypothetical protein